MEVAANDPIWRTRAARSIRADVALRRYPIKGYGIQAKRRFEVGETLGEYLGDFVTSAPTYNQYVVRRLTDNRLVDAADPERSNWTRFINSALSERAANVKFYEDGPKTEVVVVKPIAEGDELLLWYGKNYFVFPTEGSIPNLQTVQEGTRTIVYKRKAQAGALETLTPRYEEILAQSTHVQFFASGTDLYQEAFAALAFQVAGARVTVVDIIVIPTIIIPDAVREFAIIALKLHLLFLYAGDLLTLRLDTGVTEELNLQAEFALVHADDVEAYRQSNVEYGMIAPVAMMNILRPGASVVLLARHVFGMLPILVYAREGRVLRDETLRAPFNARPNDELKDFLANTTGAPGMVWTRAELETVHV